MWKKRVDQTVVESTPIRGRTESERRLEEVLFEVKVHEARKRRHSALPERTVDEEKRGEFFEEREFLFFAWPPVTFDIELVRGDDPGAIVLNMKHN